MVFAFLWLISLDIADYADFEERSVELGSFSEEQHWGFLFVKAARGPQEVCLFTFLKDTTLTGWSWREKIALTK